MGKDTVIAVISVFAFILIAFGLGLFLLSTIPDFVNFIARDNEEAVSQSIAELITISNSIPGDAKIIYESPNPKYVYTVEAENKIIFVNIKDEEQSQINKIKNSPSSTGAEFIFDKKIVTDFNYIAIERISDKKTTMSAD